MSRLQVEKSKDTTTTTVTDKTNESSAPTTAGQEAKLPVYGPETQRQRFAREMQEINKRIAEAVKLGKPVLLVVGNIHNSTENANMSIYLMALANRYGGLKNLFIELPPNQVNFVANESFLARLENSHGSSFEDEVPMGINPHSLEYPVAKGLGVIITGMDTFPRGNNIELLLNDENNTKRESIMRENVIKVVDDKPGISIVSVGNIHVPFFANDKQLNDKMTIVPVMLPVPQPLLDVSEIQAKLETDHKVVSSRFEELRNNSNISRVSHFSDFYQLQVGAMIKKYFENRADQIASYLAPDVHNPADAGKLLDKMDDIYNKKYAQKHLDSLIRTEAEVREIIDKSLQR